ncbi:MAG: FMN-binding protein [Oscillospiraceae bacterium]|nr:FMN-binding protein [Oscillospiraceae bacterium]
MKKAVFLPLIVLILCAALLLSVSRGFKSRGEKKAEENLLWHMQTILPGSETFVKEDYTGEDSNILAVYKSEKGYVIQTCTQGYAAPITMLVGVSNEGKVTGLVVTELQETRNLGFKALQDHEFLAQFLNTSGNVAIGTGEADAFSGATDSASTAEDSVYVDGISGATVTSKAIARSVNSAVAFVTGADVESGATSWGG